MAKKKTKTTKKREDGTKRAAKQRGLNTKVHSAISPSASISLIAAAVDVTAVIVATATALTIFDSLFSHSSKPSPLVAPTKKKEEEERRSCPPHSSVPSAAAPLPSPLPCRAVANS